MKIAISATGPTLEAEVDPRFGRCQYFIIANPETMEFEVINNSSAGAAGGAGIAAAQNVAKTGIEAVLTGNCGPNAHGVLASAKVKIITGVSGKIADVIKDYRAGKFTDNAQANVPDHFGMSTPGAGGGSGGGRGMGGGGGRGMGMAGGMMPPSAATPQSLSPEQEIETLKAQSQALAKQLAGIQQHIEELGKKQK